MSAEDTSTTGSDAVPAGRRRLNLKPRDETAARKAEQDRLSGAKSNPFGAAKPREAILAARCGKSEEEIVKEAVQGERVKLRLTPQQADEKRAAEAEVEDLKEALALEGEAGEKREALQAELAAKEKDVEDLLDRFEALLVEQAKSGELPRPSERKQQLEAAGEAGGAYPSQRGGPDRAGAYGGDRGGSFGGYGQRDPRAAAGVEGGRYDGGAPRYEQGKPRGFTSYNTPKGAGFEEDGGENSYKSFGGDRRSGGGFEEEGARRGAGGFDSYDRNAQRSFGEEGGAKKSGGFPNYEDNGSGGRGGYGGGGRGGRGGRGDGDDTGFGTGYGSGAGGGGRGSGGGGGRGGASGGGSGRSDSPSDYPGMGGPASSATYGEYERPYTQDRY